MNVVDGTGEIIPEPDWPSLFSDELDIAAAREYWRSVTGEMRDRQLLAPANAHMLRRLVCSYVVYDRALRQVAEQGAVTKPRRGNAKAIARVSPYFTAMREAGSDATALEAELGLSPRRRSSASKAERKARVPRAADAYLKTVPK
jgi:P27 family predicted phage terminase small subunit